MVLGRVVILVQPWLGFALTLLWELHELLEVRVVLAVVQGKELVQGWVLGAIWHYSTFCSTYDEGADLTGQAFS